MRRAVLTSIIGAVLFLVASLPSFAAISLSERDWQALKILARNGVNPVVIGTDLPATCTVNTLFFDSDGGGESLLYVCSPADTWVAVGDIVESLQTTFEAGNDINTASPLTPLIVGNGTDYWKIYYDPTDGLRIRCVYDGVEGACNSDQKLSAGYSAGIRSSGGVDIMRATNDTLEVAFGGQVKTSNLGVEITESDTNPTCGVGNYNVYADLSETTIKFCNNGVASSLVTSTSATDTYVLKTVNETVNNSVTLQNDDALAFSALANSTYAVQLFILYDSSTTADFRYDFTLPVSAIGYKSTSHAPTTTTACSGTAGTFVFNDITQTDNNVGGAGTGTANTCALVVEATIITAGTSGTVQVRWAQGTLDATDTVVRANSWIRYRKIL